MPHVHMAIECIEDGFLKYEQVSIPQDRRAAGKGPSAGPICLLRFGQVKETRMYVAISVCCPADISSRQFSPVDTAMMIIQEDS